ncbi:hypothetical protein NVIE_007590 [Nitrososphaera viennensis EN76]|uniref:UDP-N-acetyl-D-mannosamine dehydrogenase n=1 Tax=Nitrososphaera viennensis EN76 TaxID=926571 RepID=A0A060HHE4_9ARCH|nr:hypothetical protein NVIE_007590 [Nitrososphaera viennensis EN76]
MMTTRIWHVVRGSSVYSLSAGSLPTVAVYGLSTEGYRIASAIAVKGAKVSLIDESLRNAISLKADIARTYPNVSSLVEDEPLLGLEPMDVAIGNASYLFFAPRIRKTGTDVKADVAAKFKDAVKALKKGSSVVYMLPAGIGGNNENIALIEHVTGMAAGQDVSYYYMPSSPIAPGTETLVGSAKSKQDSNLAKMLYDTDGKKKVSFVDIYSAELSHVIRTLSHYSGMASILEVCKKATDGSLPANELMHGTFSDLYIDDVTSGLYDLRIIGSSLDGAGPLMYLVNGSIRGIEGYTKHLIDQVRGTLKKRDLKASRTKVAIAWTLDPHEMRGDKIDLLSSLETKVRDYIGDVERHQGPTFDLYHTDKTTVVITCSKVDYDKVVSKNRQSDDFIVIKANPLCETLLQE